ncbi:hypothetical protein WKW50_25305 [Ochrobactrum sp. GPK 3]|uniref:hypothetical protein n=1 Tax=Brucella sp. 22210 TaxID=3453892 RepID=UPI0031384FB3
MDQNPYILKSGEDSPVREAALTYLEAAEASYQREVQKTGWLARPHWYVVHHLNVLAAELL